MSNKSELESMRRRAVVLSCLLKEAEAQRLWLARELAKWELATDGHWMTPEIIEDHAQRCIDAARKATEEKDEEQRHPGQ